MTWLPAGTVEDSGEARRSISAVFPLMIRSWSRSDGATADSNVLFLVLAIVLLAPHRRRRGLLISVAPMEPSLSSVSSPR